jgi:plasmid stabilization system protein ParE
MRKYVLSAGADGDLEEIWEHIAQDSLDAADRWIEKLFEAFAVLARNPGIGHKRPDLTDHAVLFWPVDAYLIVYRLQKQHIEIVAVTQGARDIPSFLRHRKEF